MIILMHLLVSKKRVHVRRDRNSACHSNATSILDFDDDGSKGRTQQYKQGTAGRIFFREICIIPENYES